MSVQLLAIVEVDKADRVICQADGCGHSVFRRIHIVRSATGDLSVYGSDCFDKLFGEIVGKAPQYGGGGGRELTAEERLMLVENTERLIAQFEAEHRSLVEQSQSQLVEQRQSHSEQQHRERAEREAAHRRRVEAESNRPPTPAEIASVEREAKAIVRQKFGVDPNIPGWRGLVLVEARKLLGR